MVMACLPGLTATGPLVVFADFPSIAFKETDDPPLVIDQMLVEPALINADFSKSSFGIDAAQPTRMKTSDKPIKIFLIFFSVDLTVN